MAGNGNSGRKPLLHTRTLEEIMSVSSEILLRWLTNPEVKDVLKIPVVAQLIAKRIPAKIEGEGFGGDTKIIIVHSNKDGAGARGSSDSEALPIRVSVEPGQVPGTD